jgi:hypothetical protein
MSVADTSPLAKGNYEPVAWNFKLLAQHELQGFGGMGEGMSIQIAPDGRRILWLAHESAPKNFTGVDVSDPRKPKVVVQTDLPQPHMRSNSLEVTDNVMAVAYQTQKVGLQPAGFELFDISVPEQPKSIAFFDCSGPHSRGTRVGDSTPPPERHPKPLLDRGNRAHNTNVYPDRPERCYLGYIDAGMFIMDISDKSRPKPVSRWDNSPPNTGFTHTVLPLFDRNLMIVTDESTIDNAADWPKLIWILDARDEQHLLPIATCPLPSPEGYANRGGRFGAHNIHENTPRPTAWHSDQIVIGTFFNGGLRAYDISNPYQPKEVGTFIAPAPPMSPAKSIQMNDVFVDEREIVYTVDRFSGGLYILEMDF